MPRRYRPTADAERAYEASRKAITALYKSAAWREASAAYLSDHRFCFYCRQIGIRRRSEVIDHVTPHRGDRALFWSARNWRPSCKTCNSRKAASQDGGLGNPVRGPKGCDASGLPLDADHRWHKAMRGGGGNNLTARRG